MDCEDCRHLTVVDLHDTGPWFVSSHTGTCCVQVVNDIDINNDGRVDQLEVIVFFVDLLDVDRKWLNE